MAGIDRLEPCLWGRVACLYPKHPRAGRVRRQHCASHGLSRICL